MRIVLRRETEVAKAHGVVPRLLHRPQHERRDRPFFRRATHAIDEPLKMFRRDGAALGAKAVPERLDERLEIRHFLQVRRFVHAMQCGNGILDKMPRNRLVREEHELLDQAMRDVALGGNDCFDFAVLRQDHLRLRQIEVDRAAAASPRVQNLEQLLHHLEQRDQRPVLGGDRRITIRQDRVHRRVRHPGIAVNDAVVHLVADDVASTIDLHQARLNQSVDVRIEAAESRRQIRRKHVHGALGEIHRRPALVALLVERAALPDVMRHVGDVDAEPVMPVRQRLERDGIVEVARVLTVDGHRRHRAKIGPSLDVARVDDRPEATRLLD